MLQNLVESDPNFGRGARHLKGPARNVNGLGPGPFGGLGLGTSRVQALDRLRVWAWAR